MDKNYLASKINFFQFLTSKLPRGDVYPHFIDSKNFTRQNIAELWKKYIIDIKSNKIYKNLGIFIKIPFCQSKCFYCQCFSKVENNPNILEKYVNYLIREISYYQSLLKSIKIDTIYFGGGTPSILSTKQLDKLFSILKSNFNLESNYQINFEATPYSLTEEKIKLLKKYNVNRLTLGVQSMDDKVLKLNKREVQNKEMVKQIIKLVKKYQFKSLNIDLIGGLYGQTYDSFLRSLKEIIKLGPEMIHIYPFSASEETLYSKSGKFLSASQLANRHKMIEDGNKLIIKSGYNEIQNDSYGRSLKDRNKQEADNIEANASILALGSNARGHIFGQLIYENYDWQDNNYARGVEIDLEDEVTKFLIYNLRNQIKLNDFFKIFPFYTLSELKQKIKYLRIFKKLILTGELLAPKIKNRQEQLVWSKFLYKNQYLQKLADYFSREYNPTIKYDKKLNYLIDDIQ